MEDPVENIDEVQPHVMLRDVRRDYPNALKVKRLIAFKAKAFNSSLIS